MRGEVQRFTKWEDRRNYWVYLFARLKPGMTIETRHASGERHLSPDHHRRRGAAPEDDERQDDGGVQEQEARAVAGKPGPELDQQGSQDADPAPLLGHRRRAAHRLREHREPAARARRGPSDRDGRSPRARGHAPEPRDAAADGERDARTRWRTRLAAGRAVDARRHQHAPSAECLRGRCSFTVSKSVILFRGDPQHRHRRRLRPLPRDAQHAQ